MDITVNVNLSPGDAIGILASVRTWIAQQSQIMTGLDNLTAAITAQTHAINSLTTSVDVAVTDINTLTPTDAKLNSLADTVNTLTATISDQAQRLNDAVNPPAS